MQAPMLESSNIASSGARMDSRMFKRSPSSSSESNSDRNYNPNSTTNNRNRSNHNNNNLYPQMGPSNSQTHDYLPSNTTSYNQNMPGVAAAAASQRADSESSLYESLMRFQNQENGSLSGASPYAKESSRSVPSMPSNLSPMHSLGEEDRKLPARRPAPPPASPQRETSSRSNSIQYRQPIHRPYNPSSINSNASDNPKTSPYSDLHNSAKTASDYYQDALKQAQTADAAIPFSNSMSEDERLARQLAMEDEQHEQSATTSRRHLEAEDAKLARQLAQQDQDQELASRRRAEELAQQDAMVALELARQAKTEHEEQDRMLALQLASSDNTGGPQALLQRQREFIQQQQSQQQQQPDNSVRPTTINIGPPPTRPTLPGSVPVAAPPPDHPNRLRGVEALTTRDTAQELDMIESARIQARRNLVNRSELSRQRLHDMDAASHLIANNHNNNNSWNSNDHPSNHSLPRDNSGRFLYGRPPSGPSNLDRADSGLSLDQPWTRGESTTNLDDSSSRSQLNHHSWSPNDRAPRTAVGETPALDEASEQARILEQLRAEKEQKELEMALAASRLEAGVSDDSPPLDFRVGQQVALDEWSHREEGNLYDARRNSLNDDTRPTMGNHRQGSVGRFQGPYNRPQQQAGRGFPLGNRQGSGRFAPQGGHPSMVRENSGRFAGQPQIPGGGRRRVPPAIPQMMAARTGSSSRLVVGDRPQSPDDHSMLSDGGSSRGQPLLPSESPESSSRRGGVRRTPSRREELLRRGQIETQQAMVSGQSHVIQCRGCSRRLHAPVNYSLVYCPGCDTVSPGHSAKPTTSNDSET